MSSNTRGGTHCICFPLVSPWGAPHFRDEALAQKAAQTLDIPHITSMATKPRPGSGQALSPGTSNVQDLSFKLTGTQANNFLGSAFSLRAGRLKHKQDEASPAHCTPLLQRKESLTSDQISTAYRRVQVKNICTAPLAAASLLQRSLKLLQHILKTMNRLFFREAILRSWPHHSSGMDW